MNFSPYSTLLYAIQGLSGDVSCVNDLEPNQTAVVQEVTLYTNSVGGFGSNLEISKLAYGTGFFIHPPVDSEWDVTMHGVILSGYPINYYETADQPLIFSVAAYTADVTLPLLIRLQVKWVVIGLDD